MREDYMNFTNLLFYQVWKILFMHLETMLVKIINFKFNYIYTHINIYTYIGSNLNEINLCFNFLDAY